LVKSPTCIPISLRLISRPTFAEISPSSLPWSVWIHFVWSGCSISWNFENEVSPWYGLSKKWILFFPLSRISSFQFTLSSISSLHFRDTGSVTDAVAARDSSNPHFLLVHIWAARRLPRKVVGGILYDSPEKSKIASPLSHFLLWFEQLFLWMASDVVIIDFRIVFLFNIGNSLHLPTCPGYVTSGTYNVWV
jgi:hypothetical protein